MESYKSSKEESVNLWPLVYKIKAKWYLFALSLVLFLGLAYVYATYTESRYLVKAEILFENIEKGSNAIDEVIDDSPRTGRYSEKRIGLNNEIAKLTSDNNLRRALEGLDFQVAYYTVEDFWPGFLRNRWLNERYHDFPFEILLDDTKPQIVGVPIYVNIISPTQVEIVVEADEASVVDFADGKKINTLTDVNIREKVTVGEPYQSQYLNFIINATQASFDFADYDLCFKINSLGSLVDRYKAAIIATPQSDGPQDQDTRLVSLSQEANIPQKGELILNNLIDAYANQILNVKNDKGENSIQFIEKELAAATDSLQRAQTALESFKSASNIPDPGYAMSSVYDQLNRLEDERADIKNQLEYYQSTLRNIKSSTAGDVIAPSYAGINDPGLNNYISRYVEISARARKLNQTAGEANPLVAQVNEEVENLKSAIVQNITSMISSLKIKESNINSRVYSLRGNLTALPQDERKLNVLEQEYQRFNEKYNYWLGKKSEAELRLATNTANVEIIEAAEVQGNDPIWPKPGLLYAGALLLGLMLPLAFVIGKDYLDSSVTDKRDIENKTKAPLLGMIANGPKNAKLVMLESPNSAISESFKFARINLQYFHQGEDSKMIGVTSSISGEGKTFCSINLASAFAESGHKTLIICADLRKPRINDYFHIRPIGLADVITGRLTLEEAIQSGHRNLDVIGAGDPIHDPIKLFESPDMDGIMAELREQYDHIIVETPPIAYVADYFVLLKYFDVNLFIVRYKYTNKNILQGINDLYSNNKIKNLNLLFNDVKYSGDYGYGYLSDGNGYYSNKSVKKLKNPFAS